MSVEMQGIPIPFPSPLRIRQDATPSEQPSTRFVHVPPPMVMQQAEKERKGWERSVDEKGYPIPKRYSIPASHHSHHHPPLCVLPPSIAYRRDRDACVCEYGDRHHAEQFERIGRRTRDSTNSGSGLLWQVRLELGSGRIRQEPEKDRWIGRV